jgi:hypothetical protein
MRIALRGPFGVVDSPRRAPRTRAVLRLSYRAAKPATTCDARVLTRAGALTRLLTGYRILRPRRFGSYDAVLYRRATL